MPAPQTVQVDRLALNHGARKDDLASPSAVRTRDAFGMPGVGALAIRDDSRLGAAVRFTMQANHWETVGATARTVVWHGILPDCWTSVGRRD